MSQAFHIFKKDVAYLRHHIAVTLLATLAFCLTGVFSSRGPGPATFVLPVTWWFLIGSVIHAEPLPGRGHFWLTRPYNRKSLLGAKIFFILTFVNVPLLIADSVIVHAAGFPMIAKLDGLIWTQVLLAAVFELPAAALSAVTNGLLELLIVTFLLILTTLAWVLIEPMIRWGFQWTDVGWVRNYCLYAQVVAVAAIVLLCQYARRPTLLMRVLAASTPFLLLASSALLPWTAAFGLQSHFSKQNVDLSQIQIQVDSARKWSGSVYTGEQNDLMAEIPIRIDGLPTGTELIPNGVTMKLRTPSGETWTVNEAPPEAFEFDSGIVSLRLAMTKPFYERVKNHPLRVYGTLYASLYRRSQSASLPVNGTRVPVDGVGICAASASFLLCNSAFRPQRSLVDIRVTQGLARSRAERLSSVVFYSPFPADLNVDPLFQLVSTRLVPISAARIEVSEPVAYLEKNFDIEKVILQDFKFRH